MFVASVRRLAALAGFCVLAAPAWSATSDGAFAIKGIGATECAMAVREYAAGTPNAMMYGGWIYGYLTGLNQVTPGTFDLAPWQDLNTLTNFAVEYCKKNPKTTFSEAIFKMAVALNADRLTTRTDYVRVKVDGKGFTLYAATIDRVAAKLVAKGLLKSKPADPKAGLSEEMIKALKAFQQSRKLKPTGQPDQQTLFELLQR